MLTAFTPYSTTGPYVKGISPGYVQTQADIDRLNAYQLYEQIYWTIDDALLGNWRGSESKPIVLPTGRSIVESTNRFLARRPDVSLSGGTPQDQQLVGSALNQLFARERWRSMYASNKRHMLMRGDALWHVTANPAKPQGSRVSVHTIPPGSYFPINDINDPDVLLGCHIVDVMSDPANPSNQFVRRVTYRKDQDNGTITSETGFFTLDGWDDRVANPKIKVVVWPGAQPATPLPPEITALPVYHVRNVFDDADPFGSSELRGYEGALRVLSQTFSDEDLAVALEGLGVFTTNSGPPRDDLGNELPWTIQPARVIELSTDPGVFFNRVNGISSLSPTQDHMNFLMAQLYETSATPAVARGIVDPSAVASGIALALHMMPMLAKNEDKAEELLAVCDHQIFDLTHAWLPAYEGLDPGDVQTSITADSGLPPDRDAIVKEVTTLFTGGLIDSAMAQEILSDRLGYTFADGVTDRIMQERAALQAANDPFGARMEQELANGEAGAATSVSATAAGSGSGSGGAAPAGGA